MVTYFVGFPAPLVRLDCFIPPGFTPIPVEHRHMTLVYLGPLGGTDEACASLLALAANSFTVKFKGLQPFPSAAKPRYLAAVPVEADEAFLRSLRQMLSPLFSTYADRYADFRPHVSIAFTRRKPDLELLKTVKKATKASSATVEQLLIDRLCLMAASEGAVEPVCCVKLAAATLSSSAKNL